MSKNNEDTDKYLDNDHFDKDNDGIADKVEENIKKTSELSDEQKEQFQNRYGEEGFWSKLKNTGK